MLNRRRLSYLNYVHGPSIASIVLLLLAGAVELACGLSLRAAGDPFIHTWIAAPAAGLFATVALCIFWSIIRFERRYPS